MKMFAKKLHGADPGEFSGVRILSWARVGEESVTAAVVRTSH